MVKDETISDLFSDILCQKAKTSRLAVMSMVFGLLAPVCFAAAWLVSFLPSHGSIVASSCIMYAFSYSVAWILGLILGLKSLERISNSEELLVGRVYAVVAIAISVVWMIVVVVRFLLPALYYVNS